jgi:hypothetical protein
MSVMLWMSDDLLNESSDITCKFVSQLCMRVACWLCHFSKCWFVRPRRVLHRRIRRLPHPANDLVWFLIWTLLSPKHIRGTSGKINSWCCFLMSFCHYSFTIITLVKPLCN